LIHCFWKKEPRLNVKQCYQISTINTEFYSELLNLISVKCKTQQQVKLSGLISDRSQHIWSIFSERQKRKWEKLTFGTALSEAGFISVPE
jgi:hypothetical protein